MNRNAVEQYAEDAIEEIMDKTAPMSDEEFVDCLENIISGLQDSVDIKRREMEDAAEAKGE